jgi:hypothetical protein
MFCSVFKFNVALHLVTFRNLSVQEYMSAASVKTTRSLLCLMYCTFSGHHQVLVTIFDNSSLSDLESCDMFPKLPSYKGFTSTFAVA